MQQDIVQDVRQYLAVLHRRKGIVVTTLLIALVVATVYNYSSRPLYQATTQILIDTTSPDVLPVKGVAEGAVGMGGGVLNTQYHLLRSRAVAEKVVERLNLQKSAEFQAGPLMSPWERFQRTVLRRAPQVEAGDLPLSPAAAAFRSRLTVEPVAQSNLVNLRFVAYDNVVAALAVNTLAQVYIEQSLDYRFSTSSEATGWLSERLKEQQRKVEEADRALQAYREREGLMNLEERLALINQKLSALTQAAIEARTTRITQETLYNRMRSLTPSQLANFPLILTNPTVQGLRKQLGDLQREEARLSESMGDKHPEIVRVKAEIRALEDKIAGETESVLRSVESEYLTAQQQEASFQANMETVKREALEVSRQNVEYGILKREFETAQQMLQMLLTRSKETGLETELKSSNIRIVEKAEIPRAPFSPNRNQNYKLAMLIGLGLGLGLIALIEYLDNTVKTPEDVRASLDLPFLGIVPDVATKRAVPVGGSASPVILRNPRSALAEAYRVVRTNVLFSSAENTGRALLVSSVNPAEGKSTTVVNVAASLAQTGMKVLVVDADLRRPTIHQHFGIQGSPGLSDLIVGKSSLAEAVRATSFKGIEVLPCGYIPPNPAELLGSTAMSDILSGLRSRYDFVLIDSAPILAMADTPVLSRFTDGVVLVVAAERTPRPAIARTVDQLARVGGRIVGVILNRVDLERNSYYYGHYYGEYYRSYYSDAAVAPRPAAPSPPKSERPARQA